MVSRAGFEAEGHPEHFQIVDSERSQKNAGMVEQPFAVTPQSRSSRWNNHDSEIRLYPNIDRAGTKAAILDKAHKGDRIDTEFATVLPLTSLSLLWIARIIIPFSGTSPTNCPLIITCLNIETKNHHHLTTPS
jgi:hypothetical protein